VRAVLEVTQLEATLALKLQDFLHQVVVEVLVLILLQLDKQVLAARYKNIQLQQPLEQQQQAVYEVVLLQALPG
jgi:hypothetical protein